MFRCAGRWILSPWSLIDRITSIGCFVQQRLSAPGREPPDWRRSRIQVYCPDLSLYGTFNKVYRTYFQDAFPARAFLCSGKLLRDARFEVLGIAVKGK